MDKRSWVRHLSGSEQEQSAIQQATQASCLLYRALLQRLVYLTLKLSAREVAPADVKALYRRHNGYGSGSFLMGQEIWFELAGMFAGERWLEQRFGSEVLQRKPEYLTDMDPIQPVWRHPAWLNLTANGAGDNWCIDLAPLPEGHVGQIISFSHEIGPDCVIATSLQAFLATFANELEAGIYVVVGWSLTKEDNIW